MALNMEFVENPDQAPPFEPKKKRGLDMSFIDETKAVDAPQVVDEPKNKEIKNILGFDVDEQGYFTLPSPIPNDKPITIKNTWDTVRGEGNNIPMSQEELFNSYQKAVSRRMKEYGIEQKPGENAIAFQMKETATPVYTAGETFRNNFADAALNTAGLIGSVSSKLPTFSGIENLKRKTGNAIIDVAGAIDKGYDTKGAKETLNEDLIDYRTNSKSINNAFEQVRKEGLFSGGREAGGASDYKNEEASKQHAIAAGAGSFAGMIPDMILGVNAGKTVIGTAGQIPAVSNAASKISNVAARGARIVPIVPKAASAATKIAQKYPSLANIAASAGKGAIEMPVDMAPFRVVNAANNIAGGADVGEEAAQTALHLGDDAIMGAGFNAGLSGSGSLIKYGIGNQAEKAGKYLLKKDVNPFNISDYLSTSNAPTKFEGFKPNFHFNNVKDKSFRLTKE